MVAIIMAEMDIMIAMLGFTLSLQSSGVRPHGVDALDKLGQAKAHGLHIS